MERLPTETSPLDVVEMEREIDEARTATGWPTATVVHRYGIASPHEGADIVHEQIRLARAYRRELVTIERARRAAARQAMTELAPEVGFAEATVVGADAACQWLAAEIRAARAATRKRAESRGMRDRLTRARASLRTHRAELFALRSRYATQCADCRKAKSESVPCPHATAEARRLLERVDAVNDQAAAAQRRARGECGVYWGSYLLVERAMQASRAMPLYADDGVSPNDPSVPHSLSDSLGCQIQSTRPLTVAGAAAGTDSRLRIQPPPWPEAWLHEARLDPSAQSHPSHRLPGQRPDGTPAPATRADGTPARWVRDRACRQGEVRMRVGANGEWAAWRLDEHRAMPPNAAVKWATVVRRQRGPHTEWSLCLTLEVPLPEALPQTGRTVAVDVGWRQIGDELRVAAWQDSDGQKGELRLTKADLHALNASAEVRSLRDGKMESIKQRLAQWSAVASPQDCPEWIREALRTVRLWRNPVRLVRLLRQWREAGEPTRVVPRVAFDHLVAWADDDRHRWAEQESRRVWGLRRRRERYRVFAAELAKRYDAVVLEQFDLRRVAARPQTGRELESENEVARSNRQRASVSELRDALRNACRSRGRVVVAVDATDSTRTCPSCGLVADRGQDERVVLRCECGHEWDQDRDGAALVLLRRYREHPGDAKTLVAARAGATLAEPPKKKNDRWARARRMSTQKKERAQGARDSG